MTSNPLVATMLATALFGCSEKTESDAACAGSNSDCTGSDAGGSGSVEQGRDAARPALPPRSTLVLEDGAAGIGFDDLQYSARLDRIIVPAGRAGYVGLVEPLTAIVTKLGGFSTTDTYTGGHQFGTTSAVEAEGLVYAIDRTAQELRQLDPDTGETLGTVPIAAAPDYVRYVPNARELWVTEPAAGQFEIFSLGAEDPPSMTVSGTLSVPGGPESLVVGATGATAYTNSFGGETIQIDVATRTETARWDNGCALSLGLAIDEEKDLVFVGCPEGKAVSLSLQTGAVLSTLPVAGGVDIIAYSPTLTHLYLNGSTQGELTVVAVDADGSLGVLATEPTAPSTNSSCVASDPYDNIWVCDANAGQLFRFSDSYGP